MNELFKEELLDAITLGVKEFLHEMCESGDGYSGTIRTSQFMESIRQGVHDAIWQIATNATSAPCADFYDTIQKGVKEGMEKFHE